MTDCLADVDKPTTHMGESGMPETVESAQRTWFDPVRDKPVDFDGRCASLAAWVESLPDFCGHRPSMTCDGYLNLLRHMLAGGTVPYYTNPVELLRDVTLAHMAQVSNLSRMAEIATPSAAHWEPAINRLWSLVYATGKRKTMRTEDVRAALESGRG